MDSSFIRYELLPGRSILLHKDNEIKDLWQYYVVERKFRLNELESLDVSDVKDFFVWSGFDSEEIEAWSFDLFQVLRLSFIEALRFENEEEESESEED